MRHCVPGLLSPSRQPGIAHAFGAGSSRPWLCQGIAVPGSHALLHHVPRCLLAQRDMSQSRPKGGPWRPGWGRPIGPGRDPAPCLKARRRLAACPPGGMRRDFLGSPLHLRQINWSRSQETHQLPGTLRAVHTAVLACRTHAKQSL